MPVSFFGENTCFTSRARRVRSPWPVPKRFSATTDLLAHNLEEVEDEAQKTDRPTALVGRKIVRLEMNASWETDLHGGCGCTMHYPVIYLDDGTELRFRMEEHPSGDGHSHGIDIIALKP